MTRATGSHRRSLPRLAIPLVIVFGLLLGGMGIAGKASSQRGGTSSEAELPTIYLDISPFPQTPIVTALTQRGSSGQNVNYDIALAPPEFFDAVHRPDEAMTTGSYFSVVFVLVEYHYHDGLHNTFTTTLVLDGMRYSRPVTLALADDGHNRVTALMFPDMPLQMLQEEHTWEIPLPPDEQGNQQVLTWTTPLVLPEVSTPPAGWGGADQLWAGLHHAVLSDSPRRIPRSRELGRFYGDIAPASPGDESPG